MTKGYQSLRWSKADEKRMQQLLLSGVRVKQLPSYFPGRTWNAVKAKIEKLKLHIPSHALGSPTTTGLKQISIHFDEDQFAEIKAFAFKQKCSFSSAVRMLCEWGLIDANERASFRPRLPDKAGLSL